MNSSMILISSNCCLQEHQPTLWKDTHYPSSTKISARFFPVDSTDREVENQWMSLYQLVPENDVCKPQQASSNLKSTIKAPSVPTTAAMMERRASEEDKTIKTTDRFDVLLGKGRDVQNYTGNVRFRYLVDIHLPRYEKADKFKKAEIIDFIIDAIYESSGRFLKDNGNGSWKLASYDEVRLKVGKLFRARRAIHKKQQRSA